VFRDGASEREDGSRVGTSMGEGSGASRDVLIVDVVLEQECGAAAVVGRVRIPLGLEGEQQLQQHQQPRHTTMVSNTSQSVPPTSSSTTAAAQALPPIFGEDGIQVIAAKGATKTDLERRLAGSSSPPYSLGLEILSSGAVCISTSSTSSTSTRNVSRGVNCSSSCATNCGNNCGATTNTSSEGPLLAATERLMEQFQLTTAGSAWYAGSPSIRPTLCRLHCGESKVLLRVSAWDPQGMERASRFVLDQCLKEYAFASVTVVPLREENWG